MPNHPWAKVGLDLFPYANKDYLVAVDYFSSFIEVKELKVASSKEVINNLKEIFSRNGIPLAIMSDGGP